MAENRTEDYFDDNNEGHIDTREANLGCDEPAGCPRDVDVAG
jgi:hypothetical protein